MASNITNSPAQQSTPKLKNKTSAKTAAKLHDGERARHSVTINKTTPQQVYEFFRNFKNLPLFMKDLASVEIKSPKLSHWTVQLENGITAQWDAEIISEQLGEMIAWQSVGNSEVKQAGSVWFLQAPANLGTIVRLSMNYTIPGGKISELATRLMGEDPDSLIVTNLRRLKSYLETGEIPTTKGQPSGRDEDLAPELKH